MLQNKLRKLRERRGLLLKEVAKALEMSVSGYSMYERGERKPSPETLKRIAEFFDVTVDYLLDGNQPVPDESIIKAIDDDDPIFFYDATKATKEQIETLKELWEIVHKRVDGKK